MPPRFVGKQVIAKAGIYYNDKKIAKLQLKGMLENLDSVVKQTAKKNLDPWTALSILADLEIEQRLQNSVALRWRQSKPNEKISIDQFDFDHHKSRKEQKGKILNLMNLEFIQKRMDVILIGTPGRGPYHGRAKLSKEASLSPKSAQCNSRTETFLCGRPNTPYRPFTGWIMDRCVLVPAQPLSNRPFLSIFKPAVIIDFYLK